jgi:hypothetical protein
MAINVKVSGSAGQRVSSSTIFIGAEDSRESANAAFAKANSAYVLANSAYVQANSAYSLANTSIQVTGGEITGNLIVDGQIYGNVAVVDAGTF